MTNAMKMLDIRKAVMLPFETRLKIHQETLLNTKSDELRLDAKTRIDEIKSLQEHVSTMLTMKEYIFG
jgi:hypothetical protein